MRNGRSTKFVIIILLILDIFFVMKNISRTNKETLCQRLSTDFNSANASFDGGILTGIQMSHVWGMGGATPTPGEDDEATTPADSTSTPAPADTAKTKSSSSTSTTGSSSTSGTSGAGVSGSVTASVGYDKKNGATGKIGASVTYGNHTTTGSVSNSQAGGWGGTFTYAWTFGKKK